MTDNRFEKGAPIPESLGAVADELKFVKDTRLAMQKETDAVKARESELEEHLINNVEKGSAGAVGRKYVAKVTTTTVPKADDWRMLHRYIAENNRFDLLQKRLAEKAVKEMWDNDEQVPGVGTFNKVSVSLTKL